MSDDLSHDAHLRAALRHAPDHALAPPAGLSQNILAAARHAHRPARAVPPTAPVRITVPPPRLISMVLRWLASPLRVGGLATALVAALSVGLWLDLGTQPVVDRPELPSAAPAPPPAAPAPATTTTGESDRSAPVTEPAREAQGASAAAPVVAQPPRDNAALASSERKEPAPAAPGPQPRVRSDALARVEAGAPPPQPNAAPAAMAKAAAPQRPMQTAPDGAAAAGTITADAARASAADAERASTINAGAAAAMARRRTEERPSAASAALQAAGRSPLPADLAAQPAPAASPALSLLRRARAELAADRADWEWQRPGAAAPSAFDDDAQAWLVQVVQAARGRWLEASERGGAGDALEVRWWRDGSLHATLRIERDGLRWIEPSGRIRYAPLDAAALQRLPVR